MSPVVPSRLVRGFRSIAAPNAWSDSFRPSLPRWARKLKAPQGAVPFGAADVGNTGPASIPVLLAREHPTLAREGRLERSVLCGFGVGFSVAAMTVPLSETTILDPIDVE